MKYLSAFIITSALALTADANAYRPAPPSKACEQLHSVCWTEHEKCMGRGDCEKCSSACEEASRVCSTEPNEKAFKDQATERLRACRQQPGSSSGR